MIHSVVENVYFSESIDLDKCFSVVQTNTAWIHKSLTAIVILLVLTIIGICIGLFILEIYKVFNQTKSDRHTLIVQIANDRFEEIIRKFNEHSNNGNKIDKQ